MPAINRRNFLTAPVLGFGLPSAASILFNHNSPPQPLTQAYLNLEPLAQWDARLGFALDPPVTKWQTSSASNREHATFVGGGYQLKLNFAYPEPKLVTFQFHLKRDDGQPFTIHRYSLKARLGFAGIYRLWDYRSGSPEIEAEFDVFTRGLASNEEWAQVCAANTGIPLVLCADRNGDNRFSFGMLDQVEVTGLRIENYSLGLSRRGEGLNYSFEFAKPVGYSLQRPTLVDGAWFDARNRSWYQTLEHYAGWTERAGNATRLEPPAAAFDPIWNTWYPFGFDINEDIVWKNAEFCRSVGLKNLLIDAGYQNSLSGGLSQQEWNRFVDYTGDWTADRKKFPDFRKLVASLHKRGHIVTVWVALFMLGRKTKAYEQARSMLMHDASGRELPNLCPCHTETPDYLARTFLKLASDYDLDGFWLDFMDSMHVPCHSPHSHFTSSTGEGYNRCLAAVRDAVMKYKPGFLLETRMKMANINAKQFVNVLETSDMPFDLDLNRSMGVVVRSFSKDLACKLDPIQWHIRESDENVGVCAATVAMAGVPVFGVDFRLLPASHLRVVIAWMKFYREHQHELSRGQLEPFGDGRLSPLLKIRSGRKLFLYVGSSGTTPVSVGDANEIYVVNASGRERIAITLDGIGPGRWRMVTRNCYLEQTSTHYHEITVSAFALDGQIPRGGLMELKNS